MVERGADTSREHHAPEGVRTEHLVRDIMQRAAPELRRRRSVTSVSLAMSRWRRTILAGAVGLTAAAVCAVMVLDPNGRELEASDPSLTEAVLPSGIAAWLGGTEEVDPFVMVAAFAEVSR